MSVRSDEIGYWSELKLEIVRKYATAYSKILAAQKRFEHWYVDAFAGGGVHVSRTSRQMVPGSPLNALLIDPSFHGISPLGSRSPEDRVFSPFHRQPARRPYPFGER